MKSERALGKTINRLYDRFGQLADRYGFRFGRPVIGENGRPNVLFLGNHSSGKSTLINFILTGSEVQSTGVAPTDDGFTFITYGETEKDYNGPAALKYLGADFALLERLGAAFLRRLRVKVRHRDILRNVNLIDSPGMIDAASADAQRDYDFMAAVRRLADTSDLVLFMFDPEKPGTTGEALAALKQCLVGMEFKLHILMNKADSFSNMYDFARACGALCWNLARVMRSKDLPPIYTTYVPVAASASSAMPLADFDRYRDEVVRQIGNAGQRRADNMIAMVRQDLTRLSMHVRVMSAYKSQVTSYSFKGLAITTLITALLGTLMYFSISGWWSWILMPLLIGGMLAGGWAAVRTLSRQRAARTLGELDSLFDRCYVRELTTDQRDDLKQTWAAVKPGIVPILQKLDQSIPVWPGGYLCRLDRTIARDLPTLGLD